MTGKEILFLSSAIVIANVIGYFLGYMEGTLDQRLNRLKDKC